LKRIIEWRNSPVPPQNISIAIPFLANPEFQRQAQYFLLNIIKDNIPCLPPLHLPAHKITEKPHEKIIDKLHNWRHYIKTWANKTPATCTCRELDKTAHPDIIFDGHIMGPEHKLRLQVQLSQMLHASAKDAYYPDKKHYKEITSEIFTHWLRRWKLDKSLLAHWRNFIEETRPEHLQHIEKRWTADVVQQCKKSSQD
jgi:hypothetical protein